MLCGRPVCPILIKHRSMQSLENALVDGTELQGESPSVFIGSWNYPKVYIGPLSGKELEMKDESSEWYGISLDQIIEYRTKLFRGKETIKVNDAKNPNRRLEVVQEIAMSRRNVYTDLVFKKRPSLDVKFSGVHAPFGPSGLTKYLTLESNPKVPRAVDRVVSDDLKAVDGMTNLYQKKVTVDEIQRLLSVGLLGIKKKLVPTKWSITAADDTLGKHLLNQVRTYPEIDSHYLFRSDYLANHFEILLMPGKWMFEMVEIYTPGCIWLTGGTHPIAINDYEYYKGRKTYADKITGAYYSARLAVLEHLSKIKRQAAAFVIREVRKEYYAPVGVWQIRENSRYALQTKPQKFDNLQNAMIEMEKNLETKDLWKKKSELLKTIRSRDVFRKYLN